MYSTRSGTSLERQTLTVLDRPWALQKLMRYLREKVRATGSESSISTLVSGLSALVVVRRVTDPLPMSPLQENLTPSLLASIVTEVGALANWEYVTHFTPRMPTGLAHGTKISADALELRRGHADGCGIVRFGDTKMFLVDIHELEVILANTVLIGALELEVQAVGCILGLEGELVIAGGSAQNLRERGKVETQGNVAIAAVRCERFGLEKHGHEGNMRVVHGLEGEAGVIAVEVAVLDEVLDGIDDLGARSVRNPPGQTAMFGIVGGATISHLLQKIGMLESGFQHVCNTVSVRRGVQVGDGCCVLSDFVRIKCEKVEADT